ncbi:MAG: S8 family serine peptidase [Nitrospira sp.]|nr:S8 family serine peptidase [Nitrospira sp.]MDH4250669.1 S8 family serine peptidase [Nitrospira sp.]
MNWLRLFSVSFLVVALSSCAPLTPGGTAPPMLPVVPTQPVTTSSNFWVSGSQSVAFTQFNVVATGKIVVVATWTGSSSHLHMELQGRRRPLLSDPVAPYAHATGAPPLQLTYDVSPEDLARGVSWRVVLRDPANQDAQGFLEITTPVNDARDELFRRERLAMRSGDRWPSASLQFDLLSRLNAAPSGQLHGIVTLSKACNCKENVQLEREGLKLLKHLPGRHALAKIERRFHPATSALVSSVIPLDPEDKIEPNILIGNYARYTVASTLDTITNMVVDSPGELNLTVTFFADVRPTRIQTILAAEASSFEPLSDVQWRITLPESRIRTLAAYDEVESIDPGPAPPMPDNNNSRAVINSTAVQNATINLNTITYGGASGLGITVGVQDTGIAAHPDLTVAATIAAAGVGSHGTHVAGTIAGSGGLSNGTDAAGTANGGTAFQWRGSAPQAGLISSGDLDNVGNMLTAIQANSLDVANRSQSWSFDGNYDAENSRIDSLIRGGATSGGTVVPPRLLVASAGNHGQLPNNQRPANGGTLNSTTTIAGQTGYFALTKQNKNTIVVGNQSSLAGAAAVALAPGSSLGPAYDGRIKPDLLALGTSIISTGSNGDGSCVANGTNLTNGYVSCNGTSMATPSITGGVAQLLELWQNTYNAPIGATLDANPPLPALLRALLIQTATDVQQANVRGVNSPEMDGDSNQANGTDGFGQVAATAGPDYATGWGTANINAAAAMLTNARTVSGRAQANQMIQGSISQGIVREYDFVVNQGGPLTVTLAWDDFEATTLNPATSPMLVNDIDLELVAPNGTIFYPWRLGHTTLDTAGTPLADNAQPPGTAIQVQTSIAPITNPSFTWQYVCAQGTAPPGCPTVPQAVGPVSIDYVPQNAVAAGGVWVAATGKDHLNNVEQVVTTVPTDPTQFGHWKARVIGFNVRENAQSFALVGFPYPALPELVPSSQDRVALAAFGTPITFNWKVANTSSVGTGVGFTHQVFLSRDFALGNDVALTDTTAAAFGPLAGGAEATRTSTVTISQADAQALLGNPSATIDDLIAEDVFLLVRADSGDAVLEHNDVNLLAIQVGRIVDVVMVMDRSGSMSASVPVTAGTQTKLQMLQDSANLFIDMLRRDAGDRLGEVSFAGSASTDFSDGSGSVKSFGAGDIAGAKAAVGAMTANGMTNIRSALERALDLIPTSTDRRKVVLFFSDGMRTAGGNPSEASFLQRFNDENIKVFSVGFGTEGGEGLSGLDIGLLQTLSTVGAQGFFHVTQSPLELDKFFVNALANAISAEVIVDPVDTVPPSQVREVPISVSGPDRTVTFVLTWDNPAVDPTLELVSPEGVVFHNGNLGQFGDAITRISAPAYTLIQVSLPLRVGANQLHAGTWTMRVRNPTGSAIRFAATAITESEILEATTIEPSADGIFDLGEPIRLRTQVRGASGPISGADVTVRVDAPIASLGNVLASAGITQAELNATPATIAGEPISQVQRLTMALTHRLQKNPIARVTFPGVPMPETTVPGTYAGMFPSTRFPGHYVLTARTEGTTDDCDLFTRESVTSSYVPPKVDERTPPIRITTGGGPIVRLVFTPRDRTGGYMGPGLADQIHVQVSGLTPGGALEDQLNGSYVQTFRAEPGRTSATVQVTAFDVAFPRQTIALDVPPVVQITVGSGTTTEPTRTVLQLADCALVNGDLSGVALARNGVLKQARMTRTDRRSCTVDIVVPSGLESGVYDVLVKGKEGWGLASDSVQFRVIESRTASQRRAEEIGNALNTLTGSGDATGTARITLVQILQDDAVGHSLTPEVKQAALSEAVQLLSRDASIIKSSDVPALVQALTAAQQDARAR